MSKPWWQHWAKQFTPSEVLRIQEYAQKISPQEGVIGHGGAMTKNDQMRKSEVRWFNRTDPDMEWLYKRIWNCVHRSNSNAWGYHIEDFHEVQHTTYNGDVKGHYDWHEDLSWMSDKPSQRKLSVIIQLSDPSAYEGGVLELAHDNLNETTFRNPGDMLVFPSFLRHRVTDVTKGTRNSLVTWVWGPNFK